MKRACQRLAPLLLIGLLSGCAAAIDHYSGRFRNTPGSGADPRGHSRRTGRAPALPAGRLSERG